MAKTERRYCEVRHQPAGRSLEGVAIRYGDVARFPWGRERITGGAFGDIASLDVVLNVQHDRGRPIARTGGGGMTLADSPEELRIDAMLPETREADDALALVRAGVLRGLSIEFVALEEVQASGVRVIRSAMLTGVAVVDSGAYPASQVEARKAELNVARRRVWL